MGRSGAKDHPPQGFAKMQRGTRVAELLFTTKAFQPQGLPTPNVPMLLDAKMRLVEPACAWLLHIALAYRNHMLERTSEHTGRPYSRATVNIRLRVLALFYRWCAATE